MVQEQCLVGGLETVCELTCIFFKFTRTQVLNTMGRVLLVHVWMIVCMAVFDA